MATAATIIKTKVGITLGWPITTEAWRTYCEIIVKLASSYPGTWHNRQEMIVRHGTEDYIYTIIIHYIPIIYYNYYWKSAAHHESVIVAQMRWFHGWPPSNRWPRFALIGGLCYLVLEPLGGSPTCAGLNRLLPATSPITTPPTWEEYPSGDRFLGLLKWRKEFLLLKSQLFFTIFFPTGPKHAESILCWLQSPTAIRFHCAKPDQLCSDPYLCCLNPVWFNSPRLRDPPPTSRPLGGSSHLVRVSGHHI